MINLRCVARRLSLVFAVSSVAGCLQPADVGGSYVSLAGRWQYVAIEAGATGSNFSGTLVISQGSTPAFRGSLDGASVSLVTGESKALAGTVSGAASTAEAIDFDVAIEGGSRCHVGQLAGDTLSGTWVRLSSQGVSASGKFSALRIRAQ